MMCKHEEVLPNVAVTGYIRLEVRWWWCLQ